MPLAQQNYDAPDVTESDEAIVRTILGGARYRFETLMRRHNARLYRTIRAVLADERDVEDTMQETYVSAFNNLDQFAGRSKFSTWLLQIGINAARKERRARGLGRHRVTGLLEPIVDGHRDPERSVASKEMIEVLERAVDQLRPAARVVFVLSDVEGLDSTEIAEALKVSKETVRVRLHRARHQLRSSIVGEVGAMTPSAFPFFAPRCNRVVHNVLTLIDG